MSTFKAYQINIPVIKDWDIYLVDLSELDVNKCVALAQQIAKAKLGASEPLSPNSDKYKCTRPKRQHQKQLDGAEISPLVARYRAGATVYELADQFGCHRTTVSECLKAQGVKMRLTPPTEAQVDQAVELYKNGLSLVKVGKLVGANAETIRQQLLEREVPRRSPHVRASTDS